MKQRFIHGWKAIRKFGLTSQPHSSARAALGLTAFVLIVSLTAFFVQPSAVHAGGPWYVSPSGLDTNTCLSGSPCQHLGYVIQNKATAGDTINLLSGTYPESLPQIVFGLTIVGASSSSTFVDGGGTGSLFHVVTGTVTISNMTIQNGKAAISGPQGGGIWNESDGSTTLTNVILKNNKADKGGGIYNSGIMTVTNVAVFSNTTTSLLTGIGGGIDNAGVMTLTKTTVNSNSAAQGGGVQNDAPGNMSLINVTISGNTASFTSGGGIYFSTSSTAALMNVTINSNSANFSGGGIFSSGLVTLTNTIVANSTSGGNCSGNITSNGHNLSSDTSCTTFTADGDLNNKNPRLGALALNPPGTTQTLALFYASPAINAGTNTGCPATDQRGIARPVDTTCDIGAYEFNQTNIRIFPLIFK